MNELISIIVPIYNVEKYLDRCIESLVNQTYTNIEIILVDDGSPDKCPSICDCWVNKDNRIKVIHKKNGGLSDARNKGIDIANGKYIAFVDSDDFIDKDMYFLMIDTLEKTNSDIVTCGRYIYNNKNVVKTSHTSNRERIFTPVEAIGELLSGGVIEEAAWDKVFKQELFDGIRFPFGEINEDISIMPFLFEKAKKVVCIGKPLYYYCINSNSITHGVYNENKRIVIKHINDVSGYIENKYPTLHYKVKEFQGRYSLNKYLLFTQNPELIKEYQSDYKFYKHTVICNLYTLLKSKHRTKKQKLEMVCALLGIYRPIWKLKHFLFRK